MVSQNRISGLHVPRTNANLTSGFAASCAAGVMDFSFADSLRNIVDSKGTKSVEFEHYSSKTNWYGIFQDEIPWLVISIKIYTDIKALCSYRCTDNCEICRIRDRVDNIVAQYLMTNDMSQKY